MCVCVCICICMLFFHVYDKVNRELFFQHFENYIFTPLPKSRAQQDGVKSDEKYPGMRGTEITVKNLCDIEKRVKYVCKEVKSIKFFLDIAPCTHYFNNLFFLGGIKEHILFFLLGMLLK